ncbi:MAG: TolC family protein [Myxococcales bacterium]
MQRIGGDILIAALLFALLVLYSLPSLALQPVEAFVAGARQRNPDELEARANVSQQQAQADSTLGRVLPGVTARGSYTRNQYGSEIDIAPPGQPPQPVTLVPRDQWDGTAILKVPLIDLAGFRRVGAARASARAAMHQLDSTRLQVEGQVVQDYYQVVANLALVAASRTALDVSREGLRLAQARYQAGAAAALDVDRARADVEQQFQQLAAAELQVALAARALESTSGLKPDVSATVPLSDDLRSEPDLATFESALERLPAVLTASASTQAAEKQADAQRLALAPSIAGTFAEHGTNAPGFASHDWSYQAALTLTWNLDLTSFADIRAQDAAVDGARARELRAVLSAGDAIHREWSTVAAGIARSRSARAGREAATHAAAQARERYRAGTITQLDLLQAQRDAFNAEVSRIQADADLVNARVQLRLSAGQSLLADSGRKGMP